MNLVGQIFKVHKRAPSAAATGHITTKKVKKDPNETPTAEKEKEKKEPTQLELNIKNDSLYKFDLPVMNPAKIDKELISTLLFSEVIGRDNMSDIKVLHNYQLFAT